MSEVIPSGPEVVRFDGVWSVVPEIHKHFGEVDIALEYRSAHQIAQDLYRWQKVIFQHDLERPGAYLFVCDLDFYDNTQIYDLVIDDSEEFARLYAINIPPQLDKEGEQNWHKAQIDLGMVLPNDQEKLTTQRLIKDFINNGMMES